MSETSTRFMDIMIFPRATHFQILRLWTGTESSNFGHLACTPMIRNKHWLCWPVASSETDGAPLELDNSHYVRLRKTEACADGWPIQEVLHTAYERVLPTGIWRSNHRPWRGNASRTVGWVVL